MRTFIAIDLPADLKQQLASLQQELQRALQEPGLDRSLGWTTPDKMHLTLRFLGETGDHQRTKIIDGLGAVLKEQPGFTLCLEGLGAFPTWPRIRVLWAGVAGDRMRLAHLQAEVEQVSQAAGFLAETKAFSPHITLARVERNANSRSLGDFLQVWAEHKGRLVFAPWPVDELIFMKSDLRPGGAVYTPLARIDLAGGRA